MLFLDSEWWRENNDEVAAGGGPGWITPEWRADVRFLLPILLSLIAILPAGAQNAATQQALLDSLRVRTNVCPFECCRYGQWTADVEIRAYARERDTTEIVATIPRGKSFEAITGNVFIERFGEVDMLKDFRVWNVESMYYRRGDTLLLLDYQGEGFYSIWTQDTVLVDGLFFSSPKDTANIPEAFRYGVIRVEPIQRWWVRVQLSDGTEGWIDMDEARVSGADACG